MNFQFIFWVFFTLTLSGWLCFDLSFFFDRQKAFNWGHRALILGFCLQLAFVTASYIKYGDFVFNSLPGLFLFLSVLLNILFFTIYHYVPNQILGITIPPLSALFLLLSVFLDDYRLGPLKIMEAMPVSGKIVLYIHASLSTLGYLLFGIAFLMSVFFVYQEKKIKEKSLLLRDVRVPSLGLLNLLSFNTTVAGFVLLTVGLSCGIGIQIISQGGMPQISLRQGVHMLTWSLYALFLAGCLANGFRGIKTARWLICGFPIAILSYSYEISFLLGK